MGEIILNADMNEKIAAIIALEGDSASLYASAYIKHLKEENARLDAEIARLSRELAEREQDLIHADESVFYREQSLNSEENLIKRQAVEEFADILMEQAYRPKNCVCKYIKAKEIEFLKCQLYKRWKI